MTTTWAPWRARPWGAADLYIGAIVFVLAWMTAAAYLPRFRSAGGVQQFYQEEYGPAVMLACGRGFVIPDLRSAPALAAFLDTRADSFDCNLAPASAPGIPFDALQGVMCYLLLAAAAVWRIAGITWAALDVLLAGMYAVAIAGAYLALRFVSGRRLSLLGTTLWMMSPMHLANLPHLRDYSKAPWFVLTIVAMALVIGDRSARRLALIGGAFGLTQAIGFGMRPDVLLNFVPFYAAVFFAGPRRVSERLTGKLTCAGVAVAVFVAASLPILRTYSSPDALWHVALLGLTTPFDKALHVRPASYDLGYLYSDSYMSSVVRGEWRRRHPGAAADQDAMQADAASREYYTALARTFPGDFATRMVGSALGVLNLPFSIAYGYWPFGISSPSLVRLETWRASLMLLLFGAGPIAAAALIVGIGMTRLRDAAVAFVVLLFWAASPFLQFHGRHVFHLEFLVIGICVWLMSLAWRIVRSTSLTPPPLRLAWRSAALVAALCSVVVVAVVVARRVQSPLVRALLSAYEHAPADPVPATRMPLADGQVRLLTAVFDQAGPTPRLRSALLVVDFAPGRCAALPVDVTFRYQRAGGVSPDLDFSRTVTVPATGSGPARVFFPAYGFGGGDSPSAGFIGIDLPAATAACARIARIRDTRLPLLLNATLAPGWESGPLHERVDLGPLVPERVWRRLAKWWPGVTALG